MKRKNASLLSLVVGVVFILVLAIPGIYDLLKPGYYTSHDGEGHVIRMDEFYRSLEDGHFPVRWSKRLYYGYGYPFFNFNYPIVYYLGVPAMAAGFDASFAMKAVTIGTYFVSGMLMLIYLSRKVPLMYAIAGSTLYMYAPYRLLNIYVRGSVAESMAFLFPPLLLFAAEWLAENKRNSIIFSGFILGFLGISHNISALLFYGFFFFYLSVLSLFKKSVAPIGRGAVAFVLGLCMAAFFFVPALAEKSITFLDQTIARDYPAHFLYPVQLIKGGWDFGASVAGPDDGLSFNLGWIQVGLSVLFLMLCFTGYRDLKQKFSNLSGLLFFSAMLIFISLFFMFPISKIFWDTLPLLPFVQFPWRFIILTVPTLSILATAGLYAFHERLKTPKILRVFSLVLIIAGSLFFAREQWFMNQVIYPQERQGDALEGTTTWADEQATQWFFPKPNQIPVEKVMLEKAGRVDISTWKTQQHRYTVSVESDSKIIENTMYYPGWKLFIDGKSSDIQYKDETYPGRIVYTVGAGTHEVQTVFTEPPLRFAMNLISLISILGSIVFLVCHRKK